MLSEKEIGYIIWTYTPSLQRRKNSDLLLQSCYLVPITQIRLVSWPQGAYSPTGEDR